MSENREANDGLPDRIVVPGGGNPDHEHRDWINAAVSLDGVEQKSVVEYCVSEGWVRRYADGGLRRIEKVHGVVKVWKAKS